MLKRIIKWFRNLGAFGIGMLVGTMYGSTVASITAYFMLVAIK